MLLYVMIRDSKPWNEGVGDHGTLITSQSYEFELLKNWLFNDEALVQEFRTTCGDCSLKFCSESKWT